MVNNNTLKYRVEQLEKNYDAIDKKMDKLLTNHLPHLVVQMASLKTRQTVSTIINVGAFVLVAILIKFMG